MKFLSRLRNFFLPEGDPANLGLFRFCFGIYLIWHLGPLWQVVPTAFSQDGFYLPLFEPGQPGLTGLESWIATISQPVSASTAYLIFTTLMVALLAFTIGIWTKLACLIFCTIFIYYYFIFFHFTQCSFDKINLMIMGILFFSPCDEAWSLKCWRKLRAGGARTITAPLWTARLITLEIAIMYFGTAVYKILSNAWNGGEVIQTALMGDWTTPLSFWLAGLGLQLGWYDLLVIAVISFELTASFMLYNKEWQKTWMWAGFTFHLCNALLLNVWEFMNFPMTYFLFLNSAYIKKID